jgi:hypothetical protein
MVYSITEDDSTTGAIQRMIEAMRRFIREGEEHQEEEGIPISSVTKRHFQLQIKTLQNAPRDAAKLEQIIKAKERENNQKARHIEDAQRLVTEIEMLKVVLYLVSRKTHAHSSNRATD